MRQRILGAGLIAVDHIFLQKSQNPRSPVYDYIGSAGGGSVGNALAMLSLLGHNTTAFGVVGNDPAARIVRADFARFGVNPNYLVKRGAPSELKRTRQFSHIIRPNGDAAYSERCLKCGSPLGRDLQMTSGDLSRDVKELSRSIDMLVADRANGAVISLARSIRNNGGTVAYDVGYASYGEAKRSSDELLHTAAIVKIDDRILKRYTGSTEIEGLEKWRGTYLATRLLVVTRGAKGVHGYWQGEQFGCLFDEPAIPCESYRDAAGAGDVLNALAIHEFALREAPVDDADVRRRIRHAQSLASLSCSIYSARGLQRALLAQKIGSKDILGIAERISDRNLATNSFPPTIGLPAPLANPFRFAPLRGCSVCGSSRRKVPAKATPRMRGTGYLKVLSQSQLLMSHAFSLGLAARSRLSQKMESSMIFIGSGGSLSASTFGETLASKVLGVTAKSVAPNEFCNLQKVRRETTVWLVSHGGDNPDITRAAIHAKELDLRQVIVLTAGRTSPLNRLAGSMGWSSLLLEAQERGFVATAGLLSMVSAMAGVFAPPDESTRIGGYFSTESLATAFADASRLASETASKYPVDMASQHIVALGSGWSWPATVDFESKIVEGGVCTVEVSETKNFTHGRYINAFHHRQNRHILIFSTPEEGELASFLKVRLSKFFESTTPVETQEPGIRGAIDLVVKALFLVGAIAGRAGVDIAKPVYPSEARGLYGWTPREKNA